MRRTGSSRSLGLGSLLRTIAAEFPSGLPTSTERTAPASTGTGTGATARAIFCARRPIAKAKTDPSGLLRSRGLNAFCQRLRIWNSRKEMILYEQLGTGNNTDLLSISLSANDILGHQVGPDSPKCSRWLSLPTSNWPASSISSATRWDSPISGIALSADHGIAPLPSAAAKLHLPAAI